MKRLTILLIVLALILGLHSASRADVSAATCLFLRIAPGARAAGMGESFAAVADDATATYWNPGGLGFYPLSIEWIKHKIKLEPEERIIAMALQDNGLPEFNYKRYDIWVTTGSDLYRYDGDRWLNYDIYYPKGKKTLEEIASRYTGITDSDSLEKLAKKIARFNHFALDPLTDQVKRYNGKEWVAYELSGADTSSGIPLRLPYNLQLNGEITALETDGDNLWVGTDQGLYLYNGLNWKGYTTEDGLASDTITCLGVDDYGTLWVGTAKGLIRQKGGKWTIEKSEELLESPIKSLGFGKRREVWVGMEGKIAHYDGKKWSQIPNQEMFNNNQGVEYTALALDGDGNLWAGTQYGVLVYGNGQWMLFGHQPHLVKEGETLQEIAAEYSRHKDDSAIQRLEERIVEHNGFGNPELPTGENIYVPVNPAAAKVTSIATQGDKIYVGTKEGTIWYDGYKWGDYYYQDLEKKPSGIIIQRDKEIWFATGNEVLVRAHTKREVIGMHANWLPGLGLNDMYYDFASYLQHTPGWGTVGGNITFLSYGTIPTTDATGRTTGEINPFEVALAFSYGTKVQENLGVGLNLKVIHSRLSDVGAARERGKGIGTTFAVDAGVLYQPYKFLKLGAALQNLGPKMTYIDASQADPIPFNLKVGTSFKAIDDDYNHLLFTLDLNKELIGMDDNRSQELREVIGNAGMEYWYGTYVGLRAGYLYDQEGDIKAPTFGAGLQYSNYRFDFGYVAAEEGHPLSDQMRFSLTVKF